MKSFLLRMTLTAGVSSAPLSLLNGKRPLPERVHQRSLNYHL